MGMVGKYKGKGKEGIQGDGPEIIDTARIKSFGRMGIIFPQGKPLFLFCPNVGKHRTGADTTRPSFILPM
jgi:hypothetical protein